MNTATRIKQLFNVSSANYTGDVDVDALIADGTVSWQDPDKPDCGLGDGCWYVDAVYNGDVYAYCINPKSKTIVETWIGG